MDSIKSNIEIFLDVIKDIRKIPTPHYRYSSYLLTLLAYINMIKNVIKYNFELDKDLSTLLDRLYIELNYDIRHDIVRWIEAANNKSKEYNFCEEHDINLYHNSDSDESTTSAED